MVNLLFIKCITLWQILPHDLLGIGQHEPLMRTGCPSRAHGSTEYPPGRMKGVCARSHQFRGPGADKAFMYVLYHNFVLLTSHR